MLWLLLGLLLVILLLMGFLFLERRSSEKSRQDNRLVAAANLELLSRMNSQLLQQNQNLFDRTQAKDLPSYLAMTHSTNSSEIPSDDYLPQDDQSVYDRMVKAAGADGLGESLMDDASEDSDFIDMAGELGIELGRKE